MRIGPTIGATIAVLMAARPRLATMRLKGSRTEANLKEAFAKEAQANRRYLYFAAKADVLGQAGVAEVFRAIAEGETGHAHGHLEYLESCGDPVTDLPFSSLRESLKAALVSELADCDQMYPRMAVEAREEGLTEIAAWFEALTKAERAHANRLQKALDQLED